MIISWLVLDLKKQANLRDMAWDQLLEAKIRWEWDLLEDLTKTSKKKLVNWMKLWKTTTIKNI